MDHTGDTPSVIHARVNSCQDGRERLTLTGPNTTVPGFAACIKRPGLDPLPNYDNAIHDELPETINISHALHRMKLEPANGR